MCGKSQKGELPSETQRKQELSESTPGDGCHEGRSPISGADGSGAGVCPAFCQAAPDGRYTEQAGQPGRLSSSGPGLWGRKDSGEPLTHPAERVLHSVQCGPPGQFRVWVSTGLQKREYWRRDGVDGAGSRIRQELP